MLTQGLQSLVARLISTKDNTPTSISMSTRHPHRIEAFGFLNRKNTANACLIYFFGKVPGEGETQKFQSKVRFFYEGNY